MRPDGPDPAPDLTDLAVWLRQRFEDRLSLSPSIDRFIIAFSGGLDSTVLLHLSTTICRRRGSSPPFMEGGPRLEAVHVDHGLSSRSSQWRQHCQQQCDAWAVPLHCASVRLGAASARDDDGGTKIPEALARQARYDVFAQVLGAGDVLLMAHHQDDQAETVLLRLMRGAGPAGLAGMPSERALGNGWLWRPLLDVPRHRLEQYARDHDLQWVEDDSNRDQRMDRNFLRHCVAPVLAQRWPGWRDRVCLSARHCAVSVRLDEQLANRDLARLQTAELPFTLHRHLLDAQGLLTLDPDRQRNVLRHWIRDVTGLRIGEAVLHRITAELIPARPGAGPEVPLGRFRLRRHRRWLCLCEQLPPVDATWSACWRPGGDGERLTLPDNGTLVVRRAAVKRDLTAPSFGIRYRRPGDRCAPAGRPARSLKRLLQEYSIPVWWRNRLPLVTVNDDLIWVPGIGSCAREAAGDSCGWVFEWIPPGGKACSDRRI